ncbi:ATPase, P-type (transporting), HAD superfamily, subfamily IC/heavy metal translocating P-type ATPase [Nakamurella panacisegetis]|uniref:ATPase, P-type (Transporting), HAD superfamily, subfamily IC/heavy metal translocating P-type ATPase n=1 Tax=Nakamurella panacisegetis TaxID=1090615 RepID=A0A1H0TAJ2_9ACTN|nr:heavy metal translocating P-type ATPase [Nakamurella panacisegetis]SDO16538.1 ATPase, P-type (transporting), HAD superfamily, subfamily IC/heavy metal translocating P-type ATPase [Nakamurella panacisegetis]SDP51062.1 ATPase, P-type (transporting), HAD superfamily, subfamily IC/heavy metal translocating P-type ATPase [Nakamurella panacisegetis]
MTRAGLVKYLKANLEPWLFGVSAALLGAGLAARVARATGAADGLWIAATVIGLVFSVTSTARALLRRQPSVDVIALLALGGALVVGEPFAGAMIAVMLASGALLEARAGARARRELSLLVARAPQTARLRQLDSIREIPVAQVALGDRLMVGSGEIVPVDGRLLGPAVLDESALTGEPLPVERQSGDDVRSGVVNAGPGFDLVTTATAAESTYAGVVRLVEAAQASSAPFVRTADRFALYFVPLTLALAGGAWLASGDAVRAVAVLVVATPCPLLLAAPIAIMSGLSRAAGVGVVIKGGGALEKLAAGQVMLFDKTGTLTQGRPEVADVLTRSDLEADELLRLAASLDQVSPHVLAGAIVSAAARRRLPLSAPDDVSEVHGYGLQGRVDGHRIRIGKAAWILGDDTPDWARRAQRRAEIDSALAVFVAVDDQAAGAVLLEDPIRPDAPRMLRALREAGISRVVLLTGDRRDVAEMVGRIVGVDEVLSDCDPAQKLAAIGRESVAARTIMVGDGINDAPALAAAGAGVALAARGSTASSEAADVVLTVDRIDAIAAAILIARRSKGIALQAVLTGMGLSLVAMAMAAAGLLVPAVGAVLQEGIDVLAIVIALRAVLPARGQRAPLSGAEVATAATLRAQHEAVLPVVELVCTVADGLSDDNADLAPVRALLHRLEAELLPHERADEQELVPLVARALGGSDSTAGLSRTHAEIEHQINRLHRLVTGTEATDAAGGDVVELRRLLYGLYAILRLHNAQEDEGAITLVSTHAGPS